MELSIGGDQTQKFSSIYLVEQINIFRKQEKKQELLHKNLLAKIESEFEDEIGGQNFQPTSYLDKSNRNSKMYELDFKQSLQILMSESKTVRKKVIIVLKEQQEKINELTKPKQLSVKDILLLALESEEKRLLAEAKIVELQPKADFYDCVTDSKDTCDISTVAKVLDLGDRKSTRLNSSHVD